VYDALTNQSEEVVTDINKLALTSDHWLIVREVCDLLDVSSISFICFLLI
jgi:hypothetical protein